MSEDNIYQQMEDFLKGTLSKDESDALKNEVNNNAPLKTKLETHQLANELIKKNTLIGIREQVAFENSLAEKRTVYRNITIAIISVVVLGIVAFWTLNKENQPLNALPKTTNLVKTEITRSQAEKQKSETQKIISSNKIETKNSEPKSEILKSEEVPTKQVPTDSKIPDLIDNEINKIKPNIQNKVVEAKPNKCLEVNLSAYVSATPACFGEQNGAIQVSGYRGGTAPYTYQVLEENEQKSSTSHLGKGTYSVIVQDGTGCSKTIENVQVNEQDCATEFAFNPFIGETLSIPSFSFDGTIVIYDQLGNVYFRSEIPANEKTAWSGYSSSGELKTGFFPFVIKYQNGNTKQGSISIGK